MEIKLSDHFTYGRLLRFTAPSMVMLVFMSIYGVVDGWFVSNYLGKIPFTAVNLIFPCLMLPGSFAFMIGTGGSALVSKTLGEGDRKKACEDFSMLTYISIAFSIFVALIAWFTIEPLAIWLGAKGDVLKNSVIYGRILILGFPAMVLQTEFHSFLVVAEKPTLGLFVTVLAGITNIIGDAIFLIYLKMEIYGAAWATVLSQVIGAVVPLFFFIFSKSGLVYFTKFVYDGKALWKSVSNGLSELMTNLSFTATVLLTNWQLMRFAGENGIAAFGVLMYVNFTFTSLVWGFDLGSSPIISYHYGAKNNVELHNMFVKSLCIISSLSLLQYLALNLCSNWISEMYVGYDAELMNLTQRGFRLYSISFLLVGINVFGSSLFTALNDGVTSAILAFTRLVIFSMGSLLILPIYYKLDGIWFSKTFGEFFALFMTFYYIKKYKSKYNY